LKTVKKVKLLKRSSLEDLLQSFIAFTVFNVVYAFVGRSAWRSLDC